LDKFLSPQKAAIHLKLLAELDEAPGQAKEQQSPSNKYQIIHWFIRLKRPP
jgi:hypothetical protein